MIARTTPTPRAAARLPDHLQPGETPRDAAEKHELRLFRAYQLARPVLFQGREQFIKAIYTQLEGGDHETDIYFTGDPTPRKPAEIQLKEPPQ